jgi:hypothetical protein
MTRCPKKGLRFLTKICIESPAIAADGHKAKVKTDSAIVLRQSEIATVEKARYWLTAERPVKEANARIAAPFRISFFMFWCPRWSSARGLVG